MGKKWICLMFIGDVSRTPFTGGHFVGDNKRLCIDRQWFLTKNKNNKFSQMTINYLTSVYGGR